jgi:hypothetical protein
LLNLQELQGEKAKLHEKPPVKKPEIIDEDRLQDSLDNLDMLLVNIKVGTAQKERALF